MNCYEVRNFVEGDEERIVEVFNEVYEKFSGYVPRTVEYWRWCCLKRPDVREDGIFLVFDKETGNLEGYAVVGLSGNIWELCSKPNREDVASILLDRAVCYLEENGVSAVNVNVPADDQTLNEVCRKMGFAKVDVHKMFVGILSFRKLIFMLAQDKTSVLSKMFREKICIEMKDAPFWIEKVISININGEGVDVFEGLVESPTILVKTDVKTLLSVLVGVLSPRRAFLSFRMRVKPFWKFPVVNRFLCSLRMEHSWYWPLGDFG